MLRVWFSIDPEEVRQVCIECDYYTGGTCKEYYAMLSRYADEVIVSSTDLEKALEFLAEDIKTHSHTEDSVVEIARKLTFTAVRVEIARKLTVRVEMV